MALVVVALLIIYEAVVKILRGQSINFGLEYAGFIAIGYTFCIDFFRVGTLLKARKSESATMRVGFYHAIADLSSTVIALLGFGLATLRVLLWRFRFFNGSWGAANLSQCEACVEQWNGADGHDIKRCGGQSQA